MLDSMGVPRIYTAQSLSSGAVVHLTETAARHIVQVLRLKPGATLLIFNGDGSEYRAVLERVDRKGASATLGARQQHDCESPLRVTLAQAIARGERMDYCVQKAVELGVARIVPLQTQRSVVQLAGKGLGKRCLVSIGKPRSLAISGYAMRRDSPAKIQL